MDGSGDNTIGRRLREVRSWRGLSESYLSRIERGQRPVERRSTLESLAAALQVAPSELAAQPQPTHAADPVVAAAQATIAGVEAALTDLGLGEATVVPRPWHHVAADLHRLNEELRPAADYAKQGLLLPGLLRELHALYGSDPQHRRDVLAGLMGCYHTAAMLTKNLGVRGLPALASWHARRVAEELDDPAWLGLADWLRASTLGGAGRARMLELSLGGARQLEPHLAGRECQEMYGALHLNAALASAALRRPDQAQDHLREASSIADAMAPSPNRRGFGNLYFGPPNVGIWRVLLAVELGDPGQVRELAHDVRPQQVPSAARQSMFWADLGRGMATVKATREQAVAALRRAEDIAPQRIRTNPFVRETVTDLLHQARRDAGGRELRGMAYRMGVAG